MKENFEEKFKHIPEKIKASVFMTEANQTILVYDGPFVLRSKIDALNLNGKIEFSWLPDVGARFKGHTIDKSVQTLQRIDQSSFEFFYDERQRTFCKYLSQKPNVYETRRINDKQFKNYLSYIKTTKNWRI